jgi:hypothetical protein
MKVSKAKVVCQDRSKWKSVISAYTSGRDFMYVKLEHAKTWAHEISNLK